MSKSKRKPSDPAKIAESRARSRRIEDAQMRAEGIDPKTARWGDEPLDASRVETLERQGFVVALHGTPEAYDKTRPVAVVDQRGRMLRAKQTDAFDSIELTGEEVTAVRHFQDLLISRAGLGGGGFGGDKLDGSKHASRDKLDYMVDAGREAEAFMRRVGPPSADLLEALLCPNSDYRTVAWRDVVARLTGAVTDEGRAIALRMAARGLVRVWPDVERQLKDREEAAKRARAENAQRRDPQALALA